MGRTNKSKIPFPSKDPRYARVRERMKTGQTLEEAMKDIDTPRKRGRSKKQGLEQGLIKMPGCKLDKIELHLGTIVRTLDRIATHLEQHEHYEQHKQHGKQDEERQSLPTPSPRITTPQSPNQTRTSENGLAVGDKVRVRHTTKIGQIIRIMPGRKEVEVQFGIGSRTISSEKLGKVDL